MAVHDRQRRWLDDSLALPFGDALPRVAWTRGVDPDAIGLQAFRVGRRHRAERQDALGERAGDALIVVEGRDAGDEVRRALVADEHHAHLDASELLERADVRADV